MPKRAMPSWVSSIHHVLYGDGMFRAQAQEEFDIWKEKCASEISNLWIEGGWVQDGCKAVAALLRRPRIKQHTSEWYEARGARITASDIASVLSLNPYCSAKALRERKLAQHSCAANTSGSNPSCAWGTDHEDEAAQLYSFVTGIPLYSADIGLVLHQDQPYIGASPDRVAADRPLLIEIKAPYRRTITPGQIPAYYIPQVQTQLEVCDMDECHFVQFIPATVTHRGVIDITIVKRDRTWWDMHFQAIKTFYDQLLPDLPPQATSAAAATSSSTAVISKVVNLPTGKFTVSASAGITLYLPNWTKRWEPRLPGGDVVESDMAAAVSASSSGDGSNSMAEFIERTDIYNGQCQFVAQPLNLPV